MTLQPRFTPQQVAWARERRPLSEIVGRDTKLARHGGEWIGLCPFHKERTPSFTVNDAKGFYHCFGCGAHGDAIQWRMEIHAESFAAAMELLTGEAAPAPAKIQAIQDERRARDRSAAERNERLAREIWAAAGPIAGTPGEGYLRGRGITIALPPTLRFASLCLHPTGVHVPAVICAVQGAIGAVIAVHRIFLDPLTLSAVPKKTKLTPDKALLGSPENGAIRLAPAAQELGLCEGVETGLAVLQATALPVWSGISGGHLARIELPEIVKNPLLLADRDPVCWRKGPLYGKRPGEHYAHLAAARFRAEGRRPRIALPPGGKTDFNDLLVEWA